MARGANKQPRQAEKLLLVMLDGHEVTMVEVETTLGTEIVVARLSTYLWELKAAGAEVKRIKVGRKLVALQLTNLEAMKALALDRGLVSAPVAPVTAEDLVVA